MSAAFDRHNVRFIVGAFSEVLLCAVIGEIIIREPEMRLPMSTLLSAVIMAGVNGRSRKGSGLGSDPPPPMSGGSGGSRAEQVIIRHRAPSPDRTGFSDMPPNSAAFRIALCFVAMFLVGYHLLGCGSAPSEGKAAPNPPTRENIDFGLAIQECERAAHTREDYEECRADVTRIYGVDGGVR